ncbi:MAG: hypothetical protein AAF570_22715, partial [Bacteroidota bacterium]
LPLGSDMDLLVDATALKAVNTYANEHPLVAKTRVFKQSFMEHLELHFVDGGFLALDLLTDIRRKALRLMDAAALLDRAETDAYGMKRLPLTAQLEYGLLFYGLNRHPLPQKLTQVFLELSLEARTRFISEMRARYDLRLSQLHLRGVTKGRVRQLRKRLLQQQGNAWSKRPQLAFQYLRDVVRRFRHNPGMVITFSGVDGAGKSTILEATSEAMGNAYRRKVKVLRHRPSLLPILSTLRYGRKGAEQRAADTLPRQGGNRNVLSSAFRFGWYYMDYLVGQWYIWARYTRRGYVVLYDRYYFDMIADPERSNFRLPAGLIRFAGRFIRKPALNFLLTADTETIRRRKQELPSADIELLTRRYRNLFREMSDSAPTARFISLHNLGIDTSVDRILQAYRQAL